MRGRACRYLCTIRRLWCLTARRAGVVAPSGDMYRGSSWLVQTNQPRRPPQLTASIAEVVLPPPRLRGAEGKD